MRTRTAKTGEMAMRRELEQIGPYLEPGVLVRVFIPSLDHSGRPLAVRDLAAKVATQLVEITKGATIFSGWGLWNNGGVAPLREPVEILETYLPATLDDDNRDRVLQIFNTLVRVAQQEVLLIVVGDKSFFVSDGWEDRNVVPRGQVAQSSHR